MLMQFPATCWTVAFSVHYVIHRSDRWGEIYHELLGRGIRYLSSKLHYDRLDGSNAHSFSQKGLPLNRTPEIRLLLPVIAIASVTLVYDSAKFIQAMLNMRKNKHRSKAV